MRKKIFLSFLLLMVFYGCGKKGPLVLEPENPPPPVENFLAWQIGNQIELTWKFPELLADKKEVFEATGVSRVHVFHAVLQSGETPDNENFLKKAALLAKPKAAELKGPDPKSPALRLEFKNKDLQGKAHGFALVYFYGRKKSLPGPLQIINTQITPPPIQDLQISRQEKTVVLNWSKPGVQDSQRPSPPISGYQVYRKISTGSERVRVPAHRFRKNDQRILS